MNNEAEEMYKFHINSHSLLHSMSFPTATLSPLHPLQKHKAYNYDDDDDEIS